MSDKIAILTVIYENYSIVNDFINSLNRQTNKDFSLYISDLSKNKKEINLPEYAKLINNKNKGYAYGINLGIKQAIEDGFDRFCIINSDVFLSNNLVENALKSINTNPKSIIGGKIYYEKGYEYHKNRYKDEDLGKVIWYAGGYVDWNHATTHHKGIDKVDIEQFNSFEKTDFITGCLICFDKCVIDNIGLLDESYFLYFEDADYCERAKRNNIFLYFDPSIVIWHKNAQSTQGSGSNIHVKYQKKNQLKFGLKYAPFKTKIHLLKNYFM